ncbi:hypothetical protein QFW77_03600 [Luteimonas sp. RD2P54]|uniref:Uncharacterized protein n=1 Tax=Luteimonas endophytica TaxID=3042023 RepID=A0ABT6J5N4_9GAMM|nr:hypothetical protein [Luteimonas endophytica]MDH5822079.1 hypothetical protein [Luteimonas endophytica]
MNKESRPPTELDNADVLEFARIDASVLHDPDGPYMVVDGTRLDSVPGLVIARNQYDAADILLFFCDADWYVLAAASCPTVAEAKHRAEREYRGVSRLWQHVAGA